jgi:hypothetical protein
MVTLCDDIQATTGLICMVYLQGTKRQKATILVVLRVVHVAVVLFGRVMGKVRGVRLKCLRSALQGYVMHL